MISVGIFTVDAIFFQWRKYLPSIGYVLINILILMHFSPQDAKKAKIEMEIKEKPFERIFRTNTANSNSMSSYTITIC